MPTVADSSQPRSRFLRVSLRSAGGFIFWTLIFALAHTQAPLYFSNQNQYYLHGAAQGGFGFLGEDWLANTVDPTPVFTAIIAFTQRYLHTGFVYVYYALFLGVYLHALLAIYDHVTEGGSTSLARLIYVTALVVIHAGILRLGSVHLLGKDYPWYLQAGVAGQYILGPVFQPSVGGVLLLAAMAFFVRGRPWLTLASAIAAAIFHATYVLGAGLIILAFLIVTFRDGRRLEALLLGLVAGVCLAPWVTYHLVLFAPTSAEVFVEAQRILVHVRIPHHAEVARWWDGIAMAQVAWIALATVLAWRSRLVLLFLVPALGGLCLTLLQIATGSDSLALLFPWRISAVLMPLATAFMLARLISAIQPWLLRLPRGPALTLRLVCIGLLAIAVVGGLAVQSFDLAYHLSTEEIPLLDYVRAHKESGDVYLLPVEIAAARAGSPPSTSFTPAPRRGQNEGLISVDLQRFRLYTGAAIYVDFKSIPYKDADVLEWWDRMQRTQRWYAESDWRGAEKWRDLSARRITHVVTPARRAVTADWLECVYEDGYYRLYRLRPALAPQPPGDTPATPP
jgi:uncharacterized protein DUF6798